MPEVPLVPAKKPRRYYELDSLRGLAAATVVLHHFAYLLPEPWQGSAIRGPLRILFEGHQAVVLFFLLSGFVLTLPYMRGPSLDYRTFLLKRICRIYLPYLAALGVALLADRLSPHTTTLTGIATSDVWINQTWSQPTTIGLLLRHIFFLGTYDVAQFNTAFWSLVYEMRISLIFPFIAAFVIRRRIWYSVATVFLLWSASIFLEHFLPRLPTTKHDTEDISATVFYAAIFVMGAMLAKYLAAAELWVQRLGSKEIALAALVSVFLYGYSQPIHAIRHVPTGFFDLCTAAGAAGAIVLAIHCGPFQHFLTTRAVHHLGKVSYSLYLIHGTVLFGLIHCCFGRISLAALLALYISITLLLTEVFHRLIEQPTMKLGQRFKSSSRLPRPADLT